LLHCAEAYLSLEELYRCPTVYTVKGIKKEQSRVEEQIRVEEQSRAEQSGGFEELLSWVSCPRPEVPSGLALYTPTTADHTRPEPMTMPARHVRKSLIGGSHSPSGEFVRPLSTPMSVEPPLMQQCLASQMPQTATTCVAPAPRMCISRFDACKVLKTLSSSVSSKSFPAIAAFRAYSCSCLSYNSKDHCATCSQFDDP